MSDFKVKLKVNLDDVILTKISEDEEKDEKCFYFKEDGETYRVDNIKFEQVK